jgi:hypothetical protein
MKLLASYRSVAAKFFHRSQIAARWKKSFARTSSTAPTIWSAPAWIVPKPNAARASSSAGARSTKRNPRSAGRQFHRDFDAGCALQPARAAQVSRLHHRRSFDTGAGHRRQRRGLRRIERADPAPAECASGREPLRDPAWERLRIPIISICAIATAASTMWRLLLSVSQGWIRAKNPSNAWQYETSGNYFDVLAFSLILAVSSTLR